MKIPFDIQQKWMFFSDQEIGLDPVPLTAEKKLDSIILKVGQQLEIHLLKYNKKNNTIQATYQISSLTFPENTLTGDILFKVDAQNEKKWVGHPNNFHGICTWTISPL